VTKIDTWKNKMLLTNEWVEMTAMVVNDTVWIASEGRGSVELKPDQARRLAQWLYETAMRIDLERER